MAESVVITQDEQYTQPPQQLAALEVFNGVYGSFADTAQHAPRQRNEFVDGQVITVAVNPVLEFVQKRFSGASTSIEPFDKVAVGAKAVQSNFMNEVAEEAKNAYPGQPTGVAMRLGRAKRLTYSLLGRAEEMHKSGEADGLTIKVFFGSLDKLKYGLSSGYNNLMDKKEALIYFTNPIIE